MLPRREIYMFSKGENINIPVDGLSPNCTICLRLTPVAGKAE
jgi:hypothetical protein